MKCELVEWFGIEYMGVGSNLDLNETLFLLFLVLSWIWRVKGNPSRLSSQGWLKRLVGIGEGNVRNKSSERNVGSGVIREPSWEEAIGDHW